ncbi:MAG: phage/plasmid primase, P4 family [Treponema sp.]|nr:phage/plasmid primase, P4 family [Treponema sp.]
MNVHFDPSARCERFEEFMGEITCGDKEKELYLQKSFGYSLTDDISEECMFILYGKTTRNGKGTLMETALHVWGDYGRTVQPETIAERKFANSGGASEDLARLRGVRLISVNEPDRGLRLNGSLVKQMTGGDTITARFLYQRSFEFRLKAKVFVSANHKPTIKDPSLFESGRVNVVTFDRHFAEDERDKSLKTFLRQPENTPGIFNYFLKGLMMMREEGLKKPSSVRNANARYHEESDILRGFMNNCLKSSPGNKIKTSDLHRAYIKWCMGRGDIESDAIQSLPSFVGELRTRGFLKRDSNLGNMIVDFDFRQMNWQDDKDDKGYEAKSHIRQTKYRETGENQENVSTKEFLQENSSKSKRQDQESINENLLRGDENQNQNREGAGENPREEENLK